MRLPVIGVLAVFSICAFAYGSDDQAKKGGTGGTPGKTGHAAPKTQPATGPAVTTPEGQLALGSVHIPRGVKADGKALAAGTYQARLTPEKATPDAKGQTASLERWVEFVKGDKVAGREVVTIIPHGEIDTVQKDMPPQPNSAKVETLKGGDYVRLWINKGGNHYLVHFAAQP